MAAARNETLSSDIPGLHRALRCTILNFQSKYSSVGIPESRGFTMKMVSVRQLLITFIPSLSILAALVVVRVFYQVSISDMTSDVTTIANVHPLSGILSNLGIFVWCAAASICAFAAMFFRTVKPRDRFWFLFFSALVSSYLLIDDSFQLRQLASRYLGLNDKIVYLALGSAVAVYLLAFRRVIVRTKYGFLVFALGFLTSSVIIDAFFIPYLRHYGDWMYLFEDGPKWLGIVCWCSYYVHTSHQFLANTFTRQGKQ